MPATPQPIFKRGPSPLARLAMFAVVSVVLMVADARFRYLEAVRATVSVALFPLQRIATLPGEVVARVGDFFVTQSALYNENAALKRQSLENATELARLRTLEEENAQLRRLVGVEPAEGRRTTVAEILYETRDAFTRRVVIDRGTIHGVKVGQGVIDHQGVIGQVTRAFPLASEVSLVTDKSQSVPVQAARSGLRSVTFGLGHDGAMELRFIPVNADLQSGDLLVTSGIDGTYPPGLPVARVTSIERNAAFAFARILCTPVAGVSSYTRVMVLSDPPDRPDNPLEAAAAAKSPGKVPAQP
jgi:rod shape-determining protein MreC